MLSVTSREVLVVEDDTDLREGLSQALRDHGFGVTPTTNGQEALDLLRAGARPSVILLDLMMPELNGWQLAAALRRDPDLSQIPQVVISAYMDDTEQEALALPADDCLRKPFHLRILIRALERHCEPLA
jgi:CheY-like chemotaxis protein